MNKYAIVIGMLAFCDASAVDLGAKVSGDYFISADAPSGWMAYRGDPPVYSLDLSVYVSHKSVMAQVAPYYEGTADVPTKAGLRVGVGVSAWGATWSLYHHSCHNLDRGADWVPACDYNVARVSIPLGTTFENLW